MQIIPQLEKIMIVIDYNMWNFKFLKIHESIMILNKIKKMKVAGSKALFLQKNASLHM